ncbi:MAG: Fe-S cluster assembly protein SufD, partial [Rhodovibrionaceae bacterium]|nr:Fe-S cluster assembly protein SufD [Rhodovibrionaceae bacterium]
MAKDTTTRDDAGLEAAHLARFGELKGALPGDGLDWLEARRAAALERFEKLGVPTPKLEEWKFTNLRVLDKAGFTPAPAPEVALDTVPGLLPEDRKSHRAVFVNGRFSAALSKLDGLPDGVTLSSLADMLENDPGALQPHLGAVAEAEDQAFLALNDAYFADGLRLHVGRHVVVEEPIEIVFVTIACETPPAVHPRLLISLDEGAAATLVESVGSLGETPVFANHVTEISLGANASLRRYKAQNAPENLHHVATEHLSLERDSRLDSFTLTTGGRLTRNDVRIQLVGEGAECRFNGVYLQTGAQHCDNTSIITHAVPNTQCRQVYKGALDGKARAVFQGRIVVEPDAQKTDGRMMNKTLLLSDQAEVDSKPELEIFADDVQCAHGATAGELDADALFYLRARGIPEA